MRGQIERREWRWVAIFAGIVMVITSLPYWIGWSRADADWTFGGFIYGIEDGHSYLGKMRLGARDELNFHLFYTPEEHNDEPLIFLPYLLPGWIVGRFIGSTDPALTPALLGVFHLMRLAFGALMIAMIYAFAAAFLEKTNERRLAMILAVFGGGFGWLLILTTGNELYGNLPPEFYIPEGFSWLILLGIPHLALARAALLGGLLALIAASRRERWVGRAALAAICWGVMALAVPFYLPIIYCIVGAWGLASIIHDRRFPTVLFVRAVTACGLTVPLFGYFAYVFANNPAFSVWSAQNDLPSPHPIHYLLAYGLLAICAALAARRFWSHDDNRYRLLIGWLVIVPFLVYLPINVQRRMSEAVIVPLAILAAVTVSKSGRFIRIPVLIVTIASSAILLFFAVTSVLNQQEPIFHNTQQISAFNWLAANAEPDTIILSSVKTGNILPAYTDLTTFMGHGPETLFWRDKTARLERFYRLEMITDEKLDLLAYPCAPDFLCSGAVRYIFLGDDETALLRGRSLNLEIIPTENDWIAELPVTLVYDNYNYKIYEVQLEAP